MDIIQDFTIDRIDYIELINILKKILNNYKIWAFGSRIKGNAGKFSDLDLVIFNVPNDLISDALDAFEESAIPFKVSILKWEDIPENYKENILKKYIDLTEVIAHY